ncbi:hypothetical protein ACLX1H_000535 [Fusarium chlamydosporum]
MLLQNVLLTAVAASLAYAGPCKPVSSRTSDSAAIDASSTDTSKGTDAATSSTEQLSASSSPVTESLGPGDVSDSTTSDGIASTTETFASVSHTSDTDTALTATATSDILSIDTTTTTGTTQQAAEPETTLTTELTTDSFTETSATESTITESATETAPTTTAEFCSAHTAIVSQLASDPAASPFCVSYLSLATHIVTEFETLDPTNIYQVDLTTITADALTNIETGYDEVTVLLTEFDTKTEWSTATITSTRSIETITCLNSAYSYVSPVPTLDSGSGTPGKRSEGNIEIPAGLPSDWTEAQTSDVCACLNFEAPTTTTVLTQTVEPTTFVTASTDVVTPIEEYTKIITTTSIDVVTSTVTEKKTTTVTGWVVETTFADNDDIYYRRFNCPFNANIYDDGFTTDYFKNKNPLSSGYMQSLEFSTCSLLTLPGTGTFNPSQAALIVNAYFYAKETGTYTFSVPDTIDNWGYLWLGDAAYSRNFGSWAVRGTRTGQNANLWRGGSFPISLKKGDAIPFTYLWANGGGCAGNSLNVRLPSGLVVPGMRGSTVKACNAAIMSSPPTNDVGFVQQGQVDWVAFGRTVVPLSIDILARLQGAGVQAITYAGALQLTTCFKLPELGRQRLWDAINRLQVFNSASNLLYFGFAHRSFFRILTETVSGLKCIALCSCLAEMHTETVAARILSALWQEAGYPEDYEPSILQFKALVKACGGALASSPFPQIANRMFPHASDINVDEQCSEPKDIAKALSGLFDVSMGKKKSITVAGGSDCAFIAAVAYWVLNLDIYVEDYHGNVVFTPSVTNQPVEPSSAQVYIKYADTNGHHGLVVTQSTYLLNDPQDILFYTPDKQLLRLRRRVPWDRCLQDTFGKAFEEFKNLTNTVGNLLGSFARISMALAEGEVDVGDYRRQDFIDFAEASYGQGSSSSVVPDEPSGLEKLEMAAEVVESGDAGEVTFFYRLSTPSGNMLIPPGKVTMGILENTGLIPCNKSGCPTSAGPHDIFTVAKGWVMDDDEADRLDLPMTICLDWEHVRNSEIGQLAAFSVQNQTGDHLRRQHEQLPNKTIVRRGECLPCCARTAAHLKDQSQGKKDDLRQGGIHRVVYHII